MKASRTQSIGRYLRGIETSGGVSLRQALSAHAALEQRLLARLPTPLQGHCRLGQIRDNKLILIVDSAAWATRLRFLTPQLIKQFAADDSVTVDTLEVRIQPQNQPAASPPPARSPARLSPENAALITSLARSISDEKLSHALQRLAGRGGGTNRR